MNIELKNYTIRDVANGYIDNQLDGVTGFGGKLDIRPAYQREFVYDKAKRDAVMDTILKGFPLNVMYWAKNDDLYEILDGQQRTISFCQYVEGFYSIEIDGKPYFFDNLPKDTQESILDYQLMIYVCEGNDSEKLAWFKTINIAGEKLYDQELLNAVYTGEWLTACKRFFSKPSCPAQHIADKYITGSCIRQDYLETALRWICISKGLDDVADYMAIHQKDSEASELIGYFQSVITWIQSVFPKYRREMKGVDWGRLYDYALKNELKFDPKKLENEIVELLMDDDVTAKKGIYPYLILGEEKYLSIRAFDLKTKRATYEKQKGICPICKKHYEFEQMEGDHITPWSEGGQTVSSNCQMLCRRCNREKGSK